MKALTIFLRVAGLLLVLATGAVVVLTTQVDPNDYKPEIAALVQKNTGRTLSLHGDLELAFFPWLGIKTGRVVLSNREGFGQTPMLAVEEAAIKVKLIPLLKKRVEVDTVRLHKPRIHLVRKADGTTNWDDLAAKARRSGGASASKKSPPDAALLAGLAVRGIEIQDGWVAWDDHAAGQSLTLQALNLATGALLPGEPLNVTASVEAVGDMFPERVAFTLVTTARLAKNLESISLRDTGIGVATPTISADFSVAEISGALRAGRVAVAGLRGSADHDGIVTRLEISSLHFNWFDESLQVPRLDLEQGDFFLSMSANSTGVLSGIPALAVHGNLDAHIEDVKGLLKRNNFTVLLPSGLVNAMDVGFQFDVADNTLVLTDLAVASLEKPDRELLLMHKQLVIPLNADGTSAYGHALAGLLRVEAKRKFKQWLFGQSTRSGDAGEAEPAETDLKKVLKEKLNKSLYKVLGGE